MMERHGSAAAKKWCLFNLSCSFPIYHSKAMAYFCLTEQRTNHRRQFWSGFTSTRRLCLELLLCRELCGLGHKPSVQRIGNDESSNSSEIFSFPFLVYLPIESTQIQMRIFKNNLCPLSYLFTFTSEINKSL